MLVRVAVTAAVICLLAVLPVAGVVYEVPTDRDLRDRVGTIVAGEIVDLRVSEGSRGIETLLTMRVEQVLKGTAPSLIEVRQPGGRLPSGRWMMIPGAPELTPSDRGLAMLELESDGSYRLRSLGIGWFEEHRLSDGRLVYLRELGESRDEVRDAVSFARWIGGEDVDYAIPVDARAVRTASLESTAAYSASAYLKEFQAGKPAAWQQNPSIQFRFGRVSSPTLESTAISSMGAWSSAEGSVSFSVGSPHETPAFPLDDDGINSFVFNVTNAELSAVGGGEAAGWTQLYGTGASYVHPYTGETMYNITEADVFVKGAPSGAVLTQILLHETGHALGFRHSNQGTPSSSASVMNSTVSGTFTSLQSWDQDAIQIVYGNGPDCNPSFSASLSAGQTSILAGHSTTLFATATNGREPFQYRWYRNGTQFGTQTTTNSISTGPLAEGSHQFHVKILDVCGNEQLSAGVTVVANACVEPEILGLTPASTSVISGQSTSITVTIGSEASSPVTYQWYKAPEGGAFNPISGGTGSTLNTGPLTQKTRFYVRVSNPCASSVASQEVTIDVTTGCQPPAITAQPQSTTRSPGQTAALSVAATGTSLTYQWYEGAAGVTTNPISGATHPSYTTPALSSSKSYWVKVSNQCGSVNSTAAVVTVASSCSIQISGQPLSQQVGTGHSAHLQVSASATGGGTLAYQWYRGPSGNTSDPMPGATSASFTTPALGSTASFWVRVSNDQCSVNSQTATITVVCSAPPAPSVMVPGDILSGVPYAVSWDPIPGASRYELQEATNEQFTGAVTHNVTGNTKTFQHTATAPVRYWYRVRAVAACNNASGPYSTPVNIAVVPPPTGEELAPTVTVPFGTPGTVTWVYKLMPPDDAVNPTFQASVDREWLDVSPKSGSIPEEGVDLTIFCKLDGLPAGTTTGTLLIDIQSSAAKLGNTSHESKTSVPVSVSMVTPVTAKPKTSPTGQTVIIPVVGHAQGANHSQFQSDVRITNSSRGALEYLLTFTPSGTDGTKTSKQTSLTINAGETKAFNDIVKSWFGLGSTGDSATGLLEIRPAPSSSAIQPSTGRELATVATSRTYNLTADGTFGQFIPGIPVTDFLSPATASTRKISLQQVAESDSYRTNLGLVECAGQHAEVEIRILSANGSVIRTIRQGLAPGEHRQFNQFLKTNDAAVPDGRIEISLVSTTGMVSAYASVIDNRTNDPMLVAPKLIEQVTARNWVVPGVADLTNANASWRTDMRLFNAGTTSVRATLTFHPQNASGAPTSREINVPAGRLVVMDSVLRSRFDIQNAGGAIQITTPSDANLVATARTYDQRPNGTYGQFIPAVTIEDAVALGGRILELPQIEQSDRFRTNLGLTEMSGRPVTLEISAHVPNSLAVPKLTWNLGANEFTQLTEVLKRLNLGTTYNARITVKVTGGEGSVAAYASVIDNQTQDPTYVPAQ